MSDHETSDGPSELGGGGRDMFDGFTFSNETGKIVMGGSASAQNTADPANPTSAGTVSHTPPSAGGYVQVQPKILAPQVGEVSVTLDVEGNPVTGSIPSLNAQQNLTVTLHEAPDGSVSLLFTPQP